MLIRTLYNKGFYPHRDFMRPVGELSFHFMSRFPQATQNYLTLTNPCDKYVWSLLAPSVLAIILAILVIDISYAKWSQTSMKGALHQSRRNMPYRSPGYESVFNIAGIIIGIGAIMDEAIPDHFITKRSCAAARKLLVSQWILLGFLLTLSYKSVLRANMMSTEYEKGIDSIDDMINSKKPLMVISSMRVLFVMDPTADIKELSKQVSYYEFKNLRMPQKILDGYGIYCKGQFDNV